MARVHDITFGICCLVAMIRCEGAIESCAANLGLLQKSYYMQKPIHMSQQKFGSNVASLGLVQKASDQLKLVNDTSDTSIEILPPEVEIMSPSVEIMNAIGDPGAASLTISVAGVDDCDRGMWAPLDDGNCVPCQGAVRRRARRRAAVCAPCATGYTHVENADSCTADKFAGVLLDYAFIHHGKCADGLIDDGAVYAADVGYCAEMCRVLIYCAYFSFVEPPKDSEAVINCELYAPMRMCTIQNETDWLAGWRSYATTTDFVWLQEGVCENPDIAQEAMKANNIHECAEICVQKHSRYFSWIYANSGPAGTCKVYPHTIVNSHTLNQTQAITCPESADKNNFQTYLSMVIDERQDNSRQFVGRSNMTLAVTFEGNGFLAESMYASLTAGLLAVYRLEINNQVESEGSNGDVYMMPELEDLMHSFDIMASNSGGSWYCGFLAYNDHFRDIQEQLGRTPKYAGLIWNTKVYSLENRQEVIFKMFTGSFTDAIKAMQSYHAGHDEDIELGNFSAMQAWARFKLWLVSTTITSAFEDAPIKVNKTTSYYLNPNEDSLRGKINKTKYNITTQNLSFPTTGFIPASLAIRLSGDAADYMAPMPYCLGAFVAGLPSCWGMEMLHTGDCRNWTNIKPDTVFAYGGKMLLSGILAASSAMMGTETIGGEGGKGSGSWAERGSAWAVPSKTRPFHNGNLAMVSDAYDGADKIMCSVFAVADGGFADNTGILHAVSAGADIITSYANGYELGKVLKSASSLECVYCIFADDLEIMSKHTKSRQDIYSTSWFYTKMEFLELPTTTIPNLWFGTVAGKHVLINIMKIKTFIDSDWLLHSIDMNSRVFGIIMQVLVDTLIDAWNRPKVNWCLQNMYQLDLGESTFKTRKPSAITLFWFAMDPLLDKINKKNEEKKPVAPLAGCGGGRVGKIFGGGH